jgi:borealin
MPPRKRSRRGGKSVSTAINQQDDFGNLQGGTANLDNLITWLEDFDMQFEARCALIDKLFEGKLKALEHHYAVECLKTPPAILNSKILQANGKENSNNKVVMEGTFQEADSTLPSRHRKRSRSVKVTTSTFSTDSRPVTRSSSLNSRNRRPKPMTSTTRGIYQTPALKSTFASAPSLITPKVQPDVPLSMLRHPRQGELAFSTSGSPLVVTSSVYEQRANVNLRLADGRVVSILPEPTLWPRDILQVDEETRQQLLNLRNHMDRFINQP